MGINWANFASVFTTVSGVSVCGCVGVCVCMSVGGFGFAHALTHYECV